MSHSRNVLSEVATMTGGMPPNVATPGGGCGGGVPQEMPNFPKYFSSQIFQKVCCYQLVIFWLRAQASWTSLCTFQQVFDQERTGLSEEEAKDKIERAVKAVRDAE